MVSTVRKLKAGLVGEVQGRPTHITRANGVGREERRGDINCTDKGNALVTSSKTKMMC